MATQAPAAPAAPTPAPAAAPAATDTTSNADEGWDGSGSSGDADDRHIGSEGGVDDLWGISDETVPPADEGTTPAQGTKTSTNATESVADVPEGEKALPTGMIRVPVEMDGRTRHVRIDPSKPEQLSRVLQQAAAARDATARVTAMETRIAEMAPKFERMNTHWGKLDSAFKADGPVGVLRAIGGEAAVEQLRAQLLTDARRREQMDPHERELLEEREGKAKLQAEIDGIKAEQTRLARADTERAHKDRVTKASRQVELALDRHGFDGKLADKDSEFLMNQSLWSEAMRRLDALETKGVEVTRAVIDREFSLTRRALGRILERTGTRAESARSDRDSASATATAQSIAAARTAGPSNMKTIEQMSWREKVQALRAAKSGAR